MAQTSELVAKQPSELLKSKVKECASGFRKLRTVVEETFELSRAEGFTDLETAAMIRDEALRSGLSDRNVRRYLPESVKGKQGLASTSKKMDKMSINLVQPADYQSDQLAKYPKSFLIEVIRYLEQKYIIKQVKKQVRKATSDHVNIQSNNNNNNSKSPYSRTPVNRTSDDKANQVIELHSQGKTFREIAKQTGVSLSSCARILRRN